MIFFWFFVVKNMVCVVIDVGKYICIDIINLSNCELLLLELLIYIKLNVIIGDVWLEFLIGCYMIVL